jgi:hypothetical protein
VEALVGDARRQAKAADRRRAVLGRDGLLEPQAFEGRIQDRDPGLVGGLAVIETFVDELVQGRLQAVHGRHGRCERNRVLPLRLEVTGYVEV